MMGNVILKCELSLILIVEFLHPQKNMKFIQKKITCTSTYRGECDLKFE